MKTQEQINEFWKYVDERTKGSPRSNSVRYAKKAQQCIANAYTRSVNFADGKLVFGEWQPRENKEEAIKLADKLIELGGQTVVFGEGRVYL